MRAAPAVSCAIAHRKRAHEHTGSAEAFRPSLRSGFTAYFVLSPVNGSFATVVPRETCFRKNLTPAPRRQDHTTSPYASCALVLRTLRVHRIPPRVRDDREPPLVTGETRGVRSLICPTARANYICEGGWTTQITLNHPDEIRIQAQRILRHFRRAPSGSRLLICSTSGKVTSSFTESPASLQHQARRSTFSLSFLRQL